MLAGLGLSLLCAFLPTAGVASAKTRHLVILGDSLSAAYGLAAADGWVHLLQRTVAEKYPDYKVVNASISGATTTAGLQRLPKLLEERKPDILVLQLGANDGLQGKPIVQIRRNLQQLIEMSRSGGARVVLLGIRLPPNLGQRYTEPFFQMYGELARQYQLEYVPFFLEGVAGNDGLMQADGLHPQAAAQARLFGNVWPTLEKALIADKPLPDRAIR